MSIAKATNVDESVATERIMTDLDKQNHDTQADARRMLSEIAIQITNSAKRITNSFTQAIDLMSTCRGAVVVCGVGKSGIIGKKISATLASTGTKSFFVHAAEAMHGDLGRIGPLDLALLLSYSGSSEEILVLAESLWREKQRILSITRSKSTRLGKLSTVCIETGEVDELCPFNLAPTCSTSVMLALGDALAISVSKCRGFSIDDFYRSHPGGSLGKGAMVVSDLIRFRVGLNSVAVPETQTLQEALASAETPQRRSGALMVVDNSGRLTGILTDGDLRRLLVQGALTLDQSVGSVMRRNPVCLRGDERIVDALALIRANRIDEVPVVDCHGKPIGILDVQDLVALKIIDNH